MTLANHWGNRKSKEVLDEIQRDKEYRRNLSYFRKAVELIKHMEKHTISYYTPQLNMLTYSNPRKEAELLAVERIPEEQIKYQFIE